jgi:hypothetical protein
MNFRRLLPLFLALISIGMLFVTIAKAAECDGTKPTQVKADVSSITKGVVIEWFYDGPKDCNDKYDIRFRPRDVDTVQQIEVPGCADLGTSPYVTQGVFSCAWHSSLKANASAPGLGWFFIVQACHNEPLQPASCSQWSDCCWGPTFTLTDPKGVIYLEAANGDLLWFGHNGRSNGTFNWASNAGVPVGIAWTFKQVFSGGDGVIYGIGDNGDLLWYRHDGRNNATFNWASTEGKKVGTGWNFKKVFAAGGGVIYAIKDNGDLMWYRHDGRGDGSFRWASNEGKKVGSNWNFKDVFAGDSGVIYAVQDNGDLMWYRHDGRGDGSFRWASNEGKKVGADWNFVRSFSAGDGIIYGIKDDGALMWYRHDGRNDGTFKWLSNEGRQVGSEWNGAQPVFSGAALAP